MALPLIPPKGTLIRPLPDREVFMRAGPDQDQPQVKLVWYIPFIGPPKLMPYGPGLGNASPPPLLRFVGAATGVSQRDARGRLWLQLSNPFNDKLYKRVGLVDYEYHCWIPANGEAGADPTGQVVAEWERQGLWRPELGQQAEVEAFREDFVANQLPTKPGVAVPIDYTYAQDLSAPGQPWDWQLTFPGLPPGPYKLWFRHWGATPASALGALSNPEPPAPPPPPPGPGPGPGLGGLARFFGGNTAPGAGSGAGASGNVLTWAVGGAFLLLCTGAILWQKLKNR